ncbi:exodeoxyribonuclease VII small subunit [Catenovulum sp. 2E275]|uniref:exodeoxyribonuclease VII small subunit n=1 Tax=Catenovulum sp. 2E275 TaxID=2980497 RepID=UPI0021D1227C|nr:exodeoxyribonuclease VII small subunit [Catenovulum sp. 2E275]MCU4676837.1 exodeoxyribonuclease VII small subunit [Catenovulum sp. 2E275]
MANKKPENMSLETSMAELEQVVEQLESGDLPLEEALKQFERGVGLVRASQQKLDAAEQKIKILMDKNGQPEFVDTSIENLD